MPDTKSHSEEVDDILSRPPQWMLRWGLTVLFGFLLLIFFLSYFVQYPDVINAQVTVSSENPPVSILAQATGKIDSLFIQDAQEVYPGDILAVIENPANFEDVKRLQFILDSLQQIFQSTDSVGLSDLCIDLPNLRLGDMQSAYLELVGATSEFSLFMQLNGYSQKINAVKKEQSSLEAYFEKYKDQNLILAEDLELGKTKYIIDSGLYVQGVISKVEYNTSRSVYLQKNYNFQSAQTNLFQTGTQIAALEKEEMSLRLDYEEASSEYREKFDKAFQNLLNQISTWKLKFVLTSPINGVVTTFNLAKNQPVNLGDELFIISPREIGAILGRIRLPIYGSAKVKKGQSVNIKLANYPYEEFGQVSGTISSISILPKDSVYWVHVSFPLGLTTNTKQVLEFKQEMLGDCEIITEKRSVLDRFLGKLSSILR